MNFNTFFSAKRFLIDMFQLTKGSSFTVGFDCEAGWLVNHTSFQSGSVSYNLWCLLRSNINSEWTLGNVLSTECDVDDILANFGCDVQAFIHTFLCLRGDNFAVNIDTSWKREKFKMRHWKPVKFQTALVMYSLKEMQNQINCSVNWPMQNH